MEHRRLAPRGGPPGGEDEPAADRQRLGQFGGRWGAALQLQRQPRLIRPQRRGPRQQLRENDALRRRAGQLERLRDEPRHVHRRPDQPVIVPFHLHPQGTHLGVLAQQQHLGRGVGL